ncbi:Nse1 non-SMC component of SMC5-6 complex [Metarhizium album ARSEF 1941]|uniref:Non-structural maintenance of chromosomes element 1 homolog n=1 Tax=Metarhizium album (strain ARSEF 1941) TaxID=1081103 RepID=A0A0B2WYS0_METAS|nr:Nse1 non-SMC component of SMC5-6 complex [Metarhizium album ARSEF 1941]KHN98000.1 Nse1 non-SMC component of SMC5-6 complex [Metarhizium album ARSEF 1941]
MESILGSDYDDSHRAFLQALLTHSTLTFEQAQPILAAIFNADGIHESVTRPEQITQDEFKRYIDVASDAASLFDYQVRSIIHQVTKQRVYALVNTQSDPQTQLATTYSPEELAFIKRVLDGMFDKYNTPRMEVLAVTEMQAIKFARPPRRRQSHMSPEDSTETQPPTADKGLKHSEVEAVMRSLVEGGWFEKSQEGFYAVSPRTLLELRPWLVETYNDADAEADEWQRIKFCEACKDIVTIGLRCAAPDCTLRLHDACQDALWRAQRSQDCPKCHKEWTGDRYTGERAVTMTEAYQRGRRRSAGRRSTLADDVIQQEGMEDDVEDENEQDEVDET